MKKLSYLSSSRDPQFLKEASLQDFGYIHDIRKRSQDISGIVVRRVIVMIPNALFTWCLWQGEECSSSLGIGRESSGLHKHLQQHSQVALMETRVLTCPCIS